MYEFSDFWEVGEIKLGHTIHICSSISVWLIVAANVELSEIKVHVPILRILIYKNDLECVINVKVKKKKIIFLLIYESRKWTSKNKNLYLEYLTTKSERRSTY